MQAQCTTAHYSQTTNHDRLTLSLVDPYLDIWGEKKQAAEMYKKILDKLQTYMTASMYWIMDVHLARV